MTPSMIRPDGGAEENMELHKKGPLPPADQSKDSGPTHQDPREGPGNPIISGPLLKYKEENMSDLMRALFLACSNEDPATVPSLSDYYERTQKAEKARKALGMTDEVAEYGEAMEEQGFINGFRYGVTFTRMGYEGETQE